MRQQASPREQSWRRNAPLTVIVALHLHTNPFDKYGWSDGTLEPGHRPCVQAWGAEYRARSSVFVLGYILGRNASEHTVVGSGSDGRWLVQAVKVLCSADRNEPLVDAAAAIYKKHAGERP